VLIASGERFPSPYPSAFDAVTLAQLARLVRDGSMPVRRDLPARDLADERAVLGVGVARRPRSPARLAFGGPTGPDGCVSLAPLQAAGTSVPAGGGSIRVATPVPTEVRVVYPRPGPWLTASAPVPAGGGWIDVPGGFASAFLQPVDAPATFCAGRAG
jgi:hypothetical protein